MTNPSSLGLITVSVCVAIFASFTALNLAGRLLVADARARGWWILAAALALGGGTWAMHFTGMLSLAMPADYDAFLTILSLALPIVASAIGLHIVSRHGVNRVPLLWSGLLVGSGIVAMHYVGMAAMRMPGMTIRYDPGLVLASIGIAVAAATGALWLAFRTHDTSQRLKASLAMGVAISGMHYTGMAAARFAITKLPAVPDPLIPPIILALAVVGAATFLLLLALVTAHFDRALARLTARDAATLISSEERFRSLIESTSDIIGILDAGGAFLYDNSSAWRVLGYRSADLLNRQASTFIAPECIADVRRFLSTVLDSPGVALPIELQLLHRNGERRDFEVLATNLLDVPAVGGIVVNLRDITERKHLIEQLETLSETDILTGALNRRGFSRTAGHIFEQSRRDRRQLTLVMIDIDYFKAVNDTYGHAAGDLILAKVAECCRLEASKGDLFGRLGGEEFAMLLNDGDSVAAHKAISRLRVAIAGASVLSIKGCVSVTASFGMATVDPALTDLHDALASADEALYEAKEAGRNCIKVRA